MWNLLKYYNKGPLLAKYYQDSIPLWFSVTFQIINPIFIPYKLQTLFIYNSWFEAFYLHFLFTLMSFCRLLGQSIGPYIYPWGCWQHRRRFLQSYRKHHCSMGHYLSFAQRQRVTRIALRRNRFGRSMGKWKTSCRYRGRGPSMVLLRFNQF